MANFLGTSKTKKNQGIPLAFVMKSLREISSISGSIAKSMAFGELIKASSPNQAKFIIRYVKGNLKIGASEKTFVEGLSDAFCEHYGKSDYAGWQHVIRRAINAHPNFRKIIRTLQECKGNSKLVTERCKMTPGVPCKPMLAKPTKGIGIIFKRFEEKKFTCEFKYDGLRGQLHYKNGDVQLFSRNLENMTLMYPDILTLLKEKIDPEKVTSFIADSEIVAYDVQKNRILPFQVLMSRKKKNVKETSVKVQVCLFVFDMIYLNGECLLDQTFRERRTAMMKNIPVVKGQLEYVKGMDSDDTDEIQKFLEQSVDRKPIF
jgi:DNA ligase-1